MMLRFIVFQLNKYEKIIVKSLNRQHLGYKRSAARMMFIVILTFMLCRLPFTAFIIYRHYMLKSSSATSKANVENTVSIETIIIRFVRRFSGESS